MKKLSLRLSSNCFYGKTLFTKVVGGTIFTTTYSSSTISIYLILKSNGKN